MAKRKEKEHVIEYEMDIDDHKAAVKAAREQYEETLYLVNGEPLSVLEEMRKDHDILLDGDFCVELTGHVADLKKDLATWVKAVNALFVAEFEAKALADAVRAYAGEATS
jgi:hypothetical protein